jgi:hypothetical protein
MRHLAPAIVALLLSRPAWSQSESRPAAPADGGRVNVIAMFNAGTLVEEARRIAESAWQEATDYLPGVRAVPASTKPAEIRLYNSWAACEQALGSDLGWLPLPWVRGPSPRTAMVYLDPATEVLTHIRLGLPSPTVWAIATATADLARIELSSHADAHPHWLTNGWATHIAGKTVMAMKRVDGLEQESCYCQRMRALGAALNVDIMLSAAEDDASEFRSA